MTTWLITGCSTGLGRALAQQVLEAGHKAVITARNSETLVDLAESYPDTSLPLSLDVRDSEQITSTIKAAHQHFGDIDVLVNNAGYGYRSALEEGEDDVIRPMFETNYFGAVNMMKAVLPAMRERRSGMIINISSIAGQLSTAGMGYYSATKAALESTSESLMREVRPLGIRVSIVQPGPFRTDFAGRSLQQSQTPIDDYAMTAGKIRDENSSVDGNQAGDPAKAARAIMTLAEQEKPPLRLPLGQVAVEIAEKDLNRQLDYLREWEHLGRHTDFA